MAFIGTTFGGVDLQVYQPRHPLAIAPVR